MAVCVGVHCTEVWLVQGTESSSMLSITYTAVERQDGCWTRPVSLSSTSAGLGESED